MAEIFIESDSVQIDTEDNMAQGIDEETAQNSIYHPKHRKHITPDG